MKKRLTFLTLALMCLTAQGAALTEGTPVNSLLASTGNALDFEIAVPADATNLSVSMSGGSGDADLYVRAGAVPTTSSYDCRPYLSGNEETCDVGTPQTGTYYIQVRAYQSFSDVSLLATYDSASGGASQALNNGETLTGLSGADGSETRYHLDVPGDAENLVVAISGGSGDADLYLKYGTSPTTSSYDCRPYEAGNDETCSVATPQTGTYHLMVRGYNAFSNLSLTASYSDGGSSGNDGATWDGYETYYADAIGKTGSALTSALNEAAARNHSRMSYSQVWDALSYTDEDPNNSDNVILIYTGRSQDKDFSASGNNDQDAWNREHSWPKSHGFPSSGDWGYTDIHHLRPSDVSVNADRGNKDYDNGGSQISEAPGNYTDADSFEPRDAVKGDLARMMFYMDVRYDGNDGTGVGDLQLVNYTGTSGNNLGELCILYAWHQQDPVSQREIDRHARIVERQGNRNPFVDYPGWVDDIWGSQCN